MIHICCIASEINDSQFSGGDVQDTNYLLPDVPQGTGLEITISPALPFLGLTGPPFSSTVNLGKFLLASVLKICDLIHGKRKFIP